MRFHVVSMPQEPKQKTADIMVYVDADGSLCLSTRGEDNFGIGELKILSIDSSGVIHIELFGECLRKTLNDLGFPTSPHGQYVCVKHKIGD